MTRLRTTTEFGPTTYAATSLGSKTAASAVISLEQLGLGQGRSAFLFFAPTSNSGPAREGQTSSSNASHKDVCLWSAVPVSFANNLQSKQPWTLLFFFSNYSKAFLLPRLPLSLCQVQVIMAGSLVTAALNQQPLFVLTWVCMSQCSLSVLFR